jgi:tetratricopeptide (TPR) repeat protein
MALLNEGKDLEAERLALLGFVEARKGNLRAYRALALEAARKAQTPLTLYHLGLALPPRAGALALEEALRRTEDPRAQGRLALALARTLRRLGRLREALDYAALAHARGFNPFALLEWAWLALLAAEEPSLPDLLRQVEPLSLRGGAGLYARLLMTHLRLLQGEEPTARAYLRKALEEAPLPALPYLTPMPEGKVELECTTFKWNWKRTFALLAERAGEAEPAPRPCTS